MKHTNLTNEIDAHTTPTPLWMYVTLAAVALGLAIIVTEVIFGEMITSWMYSE